MKPKFFNERIWATIKDFQGKDFSLVEDNSKAFEIISNIAAWAGQSALAEAKAAGLSRSFVRDNKIIRLHSNGREEIIEDKMQQGSKYFYHYPPTTVFHAIKK